MTLQLQKPATGAVPIPVADAAVLVPIQITMMAKIAAVYGLSTNTGSSGILRARRSAAAVSPESPASDQQCWR